MNLIKFPLDTEMHFKHPISFANTVIAMTNPIVSMKNESANFIIFNLVSFPFDKLGFTVVSKSTG